MKSRIKRWLKLASVIVFPAVALATSLPARALTPADQKEVQNFTLTDDFLKRFEAAAAEGGARAEENDPKKAAAMLSSIDAMSASIAKTPASKAALERHGLTPRQAMARRAATASASCSSTGRVFSQDRQASVMLWPRTRGLDL